MLNDVEYQRIMKTNSTLDCLKEKLKKKINRLYFSEQF